MVVKVNDVEAVDDVVVADPASVRHSLQPLWPIEESEYQLMLAVGVMSLGPALPEYRTPLTVR